MSSFVEVFYDPADVFGRVRERGSWALPLIVTALIIILFTLFVTRTIGMENIVRRAFDEHPALTSQIPAEKKEQAIQQAASPIRTWIGALFAGIGTALKSLIIAVILMVMLAIMDRKPQLPQILGTVAWASYPFALIAAVMGILVLLVSRDPTELSPQTLVATNAAAFLDKNSTGRFLYSLAGSFDLLVIGNVLLLGFGLSKVTGFAFARALTLVVSLWLVWVLLRGGFAAAFGF